MSDASDLNPPALTPLFDVRYALTPIVDFGTIPIGRRLFAATTGGVFDGERISGTVLSGGSDWILIGADGTSRLNVNLVFRTSEGALIHATWTGIVVADVAVQRKLADPSQRGSADLASYSFLVSATFETGDADIAWLNRTLAIGRARFTAEGLHYRFATVG